jgi:hypothetical protein
MLALVGSSRRVAKRLIHGGAFVPQLAGPVGAGSSAFGVYTGVVGIGRLSIALGAIFIAVGLLFTFAGRLPLKLGRLPGDIYIQGRHSSFFFPLTTCILISAVLSLAMWLLRR